MLDLRVLFRARETRDKADSACKNVQHLAARYINQTHLLETTIDNSRQSFPKTAHRLAGYGRTLATICISFLLYVARHGDIEFNGIK